MHSFTITMDKGRIRGHNDIGRYMSALPNQENGWTVFDRDDTMGLAALPTKRQAMNYMAEHLAGMV